MKKFERGIMFFMMFILGISFAGAHLGNDEFSHHGMMGEFSGWGMGAFGLLFMTLVIVVLILLIIWLAKQLNQKEKKRERRHRKK